MLKILRAWSNVQGRKGRSGAVANRDRILRSMAGFKAGAVRPPVSLKGPRDIVRAIFGNV